ncbi:MAG: rod-binding protein [Acidobacteriia bacterium]|nr:rod-binding protein [Terriglobia bacterium]
MNVSLQTGGISNPTATQPAPGQSASRLKLRKAASEFESILLSSLWKSMKTTVAGADDSGAGETLSDLGIQAVSSALARAGGLGIAKLIVRALDKSETSAPPSQQKAL